MTEKQLQIDIENRKRIFDKNYRDVIDRIDKAAKQVGRRAEDIRLLAATKTVPVEIINYAASKGLTLMGENRVQEFLSKENDLDEGIERHFIGKLQTNKVKQIVGKVGLIHSVDSLHLAQEISKRSQAAGIITDILIEINIGNEQTKSGISYEEAEQFVREISVLEGIKVKGLMAIPPKCETQSEISAFFEQMQKLYIDISSKNIDNIDMVYLSMGMSSDFEEAIKKGANIIRVGSLLFGNRVYEHN